MNNKLRLELKKAFYDTLNRIENDEFLIEQNKIALNNTFIYREEETIGTDSFEKFDGKVSVVNNTTTGAVEYDNTAILNFASAVLIGGQPQNGFTTQEEVINRSTTLFPTLNSVQVRRDYYDYFKKFGNDLYTDRMIISRNIYIIKDDSLIPNPLIKPEYLKIDVISSPAPNLVKIKISDEKYKEIYKSRISKIFRLAALYKNTNIIVGAFGCGAFKNNPELAATCFKEVLYDERYKDYFENVVFAIPKSENNMNLEIFEDILCR